jgi:hypothetical protein
VITVSLYILSVLVKREHLTPSSCVVDEIDIYIYIYIYKQQLIVRVINSIDNYFIPLLSL